MTRSDGGIAPSAGTRNSGSSPRYQRLTTTAETADSRIEPSTLAFQEPITSSMTNNTAVIGVLNAAAMPAAAPTGAISLK